MAAELKASGIQPHQFSVTTVITYHNCKTPGCTTMCPIPESMCWLCTSASLSLLSASLLIHSRMAGSCPLHLRPELEQWADLTVLQFLFMGCPGHVCKAEAWMGRETVEAKTEHACVHFCCSLWSRQVTNQKEEITSLLSGSPSNVVQVKNWVPPPQLSYMSDPYHHDDSPGGNPSPLFHWIRPDDHLWGLSQTCLGYRYMTHTGSNQPWPEFVCEHWERDIGPLQPVSHMDWRC